MDGTWGGLLSRKALVLAKREGTPGADASPAASANALIVSNPQIALNADQIAREIVRDTLTPLGWIIGTRSIGITFTTEQHGIGSPIPSSATPLREDALFRAAQLFATYSPAATPQTATYFPESDVGTSPYTEATVTIYTYLDSVLVKAKGCKANLEVVQQVGQFGKLNWTLQGVFDAPTSGTPAAGGILDSATPSATFQSGYVAPKPCMQANAFSTHSYRSADIEQISWNMNNDIQPRPSMNQANGIIGFQCP